MRTFEAEPRGPVPAPADMQPSQLIQTSTKQLTGCSPQLLEKKKRRRNSVCLKRQKRYFRSYELGTNNTQRKTFSSTLCHPYVYAHTGTHFIATGYIINEFGMVVTSGQLVR